METDTTTAATAAIVGQASCLPDGAPAAADIVDIQPPSGGAINRPVKSGDKSPHSIKIPPPYYGVRRLVAAFDGGIYSPAPSATAAPIVTAVDAGVVVRLSVTTRCQLRCAYCLPAGGAGGSDKWQVTSDKESVVRGGGENAVREAHGAGAESTRLPLDTCHLPLATSAAGCSELPSDDLVRLVALIHAVRPVRRVRLTGGEPLLRRDLPEIVAGLAALGIPELALTTNGQLLAARAAALRRAGVRRVNVSLDSLRPDVFAALSRGGVLARTLAGIRAARDAGLGPVKLNTVVLRGRNDTEPPALLRFALRAGCHIRFLELMPVGEAAKNFEREFVPAAEIRSRLDALPGLAWTALPWSPAETSRDWLVRDEDGRETVCGFIAPTSRPFCAGCARLRLTSDGRLHGCLARPGAHDLTPLLAPSGRAGARRRLAEILASAFAQKLGPRFDRASPLMAAIGG